MKTLKAVKLTKSQEIVDTLAKEASDIYYNSNGKIEPIRDLAKRFNTTTATVCKAVDHLARRGIIEKQHGRGLFVRKAKMTKAVAFVLESRYLAEALTPFYPRLLSQMEQAFRKHKWACRYFFNIETEFGAQDFDFALQQGHIDGVVYVSEWFYENKLAQVEASNIPCASIYRNGDKGRSVNGDGIRDELTLGFRELKRLGRKRIAMICQQPEPDWNEYGRQSYSDWLRYAEEVIGADMIEMAPTTTQAGWNTMKSLWKNKKPDAVLVMCETHTRGVIPAVLAMGLTVPDDIVLACEVVEGADRIMGIPIIEIRLPVRDQAEALAEMITTLAAGHKVEQENVVLSPLLYNPFLT